MGRGNEDIWVNFHTWLVGDRSYFRPGNGWPLRPLTVVVLIPHSPFRTSSTPRGAQRLRAWALGPAWLHSYLGSATAQSMAFCYLVSRPVITPAISPPTLLLSLLLQQLTFSSLEEPCPFPSLALCLCCLCFQIPRVQMVLPVQFVYWKSDRHLKLADPWREKDSDRDCRSHASVAFLKRQWWALTCF